MAASQGSTIRGYQTSNRCVEPGHMGLQKEGHLRALYSLLQNFVHKYSEYSEHLLDFKAVLILPAYVKTDIPFIVWYLLSFEYHVPGKRIQAAGGHISRPGVGRNP